MLNFNQQLFVNCLYKNFNICLINLEKSISFALRLKNVFILIIKKIKRNVTSLSDNR